MPAITFDLKIVTSDVDFTIQNNNGDATITDPDKPVPKLAVWERDNILADWAKTLILDPAVYDVNLDVTTPGGSVDLGVGGVFVSIAPAIATITTTKVVDYTLTV